MTDTQRRGFIADETYDDFDYDGVPDAEGETLGEKFQNIVDTKSMRAIDGQIIDLFTAGIVASVYRALGDEAKAKFDSLSVQKVVSIGYKLANKYGVS